MSNGNFFHIYLRPKPGVTESQIEEEMSRLIDWFHYGSHNWVVYSMEDAPALWQQFKPLVEPDGAIFICRLEEQSRSGLMPTALWNWLKKPRQSPVTISSFSSNGALGSLLREQTDKSFVPAGR